MRHDDSMCDHWYFVLYCTSGYEIPATQRTWSNSIPFNRVGPALSTLDELFQQSKIPIGAVMRWCPMVGITTVRVIGNRKLAEMYNQDPDLVLDTAFATIKSAIDKCVKEQLLAKGKIR